MRSPRHFYLWFLPLAFGLNSFFSFNYPGDEYSMWGIASFPGVWIAMLKNGDIQELHYTVPLGGILIMAFIGWRMDKLPVKKKLWLACFLGVALAVGVSLLAMHGSFSRTLERAGSFAAFGLFLVGIGIWLGSLFSIALAFVIRNWIRKPAVVQTPS